MLEESIQFKNGKEVEAMVEELLEERGWDVIETTQYQEQRLKLGDRIVAKEGFEFSIEIKSGRQTKYTHNLFMETYSHGKPGWLITNNSDLLFYVLSDRILIFDPQQLKHIDYSVFRHVTNRYGTASGFLVPVTYCENHLALSTIPLEREWC